MVEGFGNERGTKDSSCRWIVQVIDDPRVSVRCTPQPAKHDVAWTAAEAKYLSGLVVMLYRQSSGLPGGDSTDRTASTLSLVKRPVALLGYAVGLLHRSTVSVELGRPFVGTVMGGATGLANARHYWARGGDAPREAVHATDAHGSCIAQPGTESNPRKVG